MTRAHFSGGVGADGTNPASGNAAPADALKPTDALNRCIAMDKRQFASRHWGQQPLFTRAAELGTFRDELLSVAAVDELISRRGLRTPFLRMAKDGKVIPAGRYTRPGGTGAMISDQAADDKLLGLINDGATLVLQGLQRLWPPIVSFGTQLSSELGHPVQVNAYVTPSQNQGFAAHYDTHDVFVMQISGRKRWVIAEPVLRNPLPEQNWERYRDEVAARAGQKPLLDLTVEPGDVLYLPRGYLHSATALGELSIHLTVGVHPITRHGLLQNLLGTLASDEQLRASLPMDVNLADPTVLAPLLADAARRMTEMLAAPGEQRIDAVADQVASALSRTTRPAPIAPLAQASAIDSLEGSSTLRLRPGLRLTIRPGADNVEVRFLDRSISLPSHHRAALEFIVAGSVVTPKDLPGLDENAQLSLARRLLVDAILVPAPNGSSA